MRQGNLERERIQPLMVRPSWGRSCFPLFRLFCGVGGCIWGAGWAGEPVSLDTLQMRERSVSSAGSGSQSLPALVRIDSIDLLHSAGTGADLNRVLALDIAAGGTGLLSDNSLSVRGGRPDENRYILNGIELPNLNHFSLGSDGALGFVSSATVRSVDLYAGVPPSRYAGGASSTILVNTRGGDAGRVGTTLGISITGGEALVEGPLGRQSGAFLAQARYFDARPVRDWITTGQVPRFADGSLTLDLNHGESSYSRAYGFFTWDRMESGIPGERHDQRDHYRRGALSFMNFAGMGRVGIETGVSGLLSDKRTHWQGDPAGSVDGAKYLIGVEEGLGRAYSHGTYTWAGGSRLEVGGDLKITADRLSQGTPLSGERDSAISCARTGGFAEYFASLGPFGAVAGLRAERYSAFEGWGISPRLSLTRRLGKSSRITVDGSLDYEPYGELAEVGALAVFDSTAEPLELGTLGLRRTWYAGLTLAGTLAGVAWETGLFGKSYDREFKSIDGMNTLYRGEIRTDGGRSYTEFITPTGRRFARGAEVQVKGGSMRRFRYTVGALLQTIGNEYIGGESFPDRHSVGYATKAAAYWKPLPTHLVSYSLTAQQGRPYWSEAQLLTERFYSQRFPNLVFMSLRYTYEEQVFGYPFSLYLEVDNVLNRTQPAFQELRTDGNHRYLSPNGIFPLVGMRVRL